MKKNKPYRDAKGHFAKRPQSKSLKGRYYKGRIERKPSEYNKFQSLVAEYVRNNPDLLEYKNFGGFSKLSGKIWQGVKKTPIKEIANNIDIIIEDAIAPISERTISARKFKETYQNIPWYYILDDMLEKILKNKHLLPGDKLIFDGEGMVNDFTFDISNPGDFRKKSFLLYRLLKLLIYDHKSPVPIINIDSFPQMRDDEKWEIIIKIDIPEEQKEKLRISDRTSQGQLILNDEQIKTFVASEEAISLTEEHREEKEQLKKDIEKQKEIDRKKRQKAAEETLEERKMLRQIELEKEKQKTMDKIIELKKLFPDATLKQIKDMLKE